MLRSRFSMLFAVTALTVLVTCDRGWAHPLPGQVLKFQQLPLDGAVVDNTPWYGHDELSTIVGSHTAGQYSQGIFMADDFADLSSDPVVHIRWWGSYLQGVGEPNAAGGGGVQKFLVAFESDVPAGVPHPIDGTIRPYSTPGVPLLNQIVDLGALSPGSGTFTETFKSPGGAPLFEHLYEYNAELAIPFPEQKDTVYWLKIVALNDPSSVKSDGSLEGPIRWGWHNRDWTVSNPLASVAPNVTPGESQVGFVSDGFGPNGVIPKPVYHFQDDAVRGNLNFVSIVQPGNIVQIGQSNYDDEYYLDLIDGPGPIPGTNILGIGSFSKDLAFELYRAVPEPSMGLMGILGLGMLIAQGRRRLR